MALTSPGVEVTIIDQSQYLPAPTNSVPLVVIATAQNKANGSGTGVAVGTTAANAGKLFQVTSQRDLVDLYGKPFFYSTTNGTPIQGYELNEYGLLAAYSVLGVTNRCYVLRADIDLASLVGQTSRPSGAPDTGTYWLDTTTSTWGIYEFNASTGQFQLMEPIVISDSTSLSANVPLNSIGNIGDYAVNAIQTTSAPNTYGQYFYKTTDNLWVTLGSNAWAQDWPTVQGTQTPTSLTAGNTFTINVGGYYSFVVTVPAGPNNTVSGVATAINNLGSGYLNAEVINGKLNIYSIQPALSGARPFIQIISGTGTVLNNLGITPNYYFQPVLDYGTAAQMPLWSSSQQLPAPTGSVWIKVGSSGNGLNPNVLEYNGVTQSWNARTLSLANSDWTATNALDSTGGLAIPAGTVYAQYDYLGALNTGPVYLWERVATGPTVVTGTTTNWTLASLLESPSTIAIRVSLPGSSTLSSYYVMSVANGMTPTGFVTAWAATGVPYTTCSVTTDGAIQITHTAGGEIQINEFVQTGANQGKPLGVLSQIGVVIGDPGVKYGSSSSPTFTALATGGTLGNSGTATIRVIPRYGQYFLVGTGISVNGTGYAVGDTLTVAGNLLGGTAPANNLVVKVVSINGSGGITAVTYVSGNPNPQPYVTQLSNWVEFEYTANEGAPVALPTNNTNWFYSVVDQVDIMVNYNGQWNGYRNLNYDSSGFPSYTGSNVTDPNGPIVSASIPTTQSDGTALEYGDLWIDTSDLEIYPVINRWQSVGGIDQWVVINNADQTSSSGVLFADARWSSSGAINPVDDPIPTITSLLTSDYIDLDAPDQSLYPNGMMLFNTRRSGYTVKQFRTNYFTGTNYPNAGVYNPADPTNVDDLPEFSYTWVTVSGNQADGRPYMGRNAQRAMVVESLRSVVDTNSDIRDEDNFFNLMATPYYPELQPNMVVLNADRGETCYIIGDTPMRLPANATAIQAWATNAAGAPSTGEEGCVTRNTYLGLFYPSGLTSDLSGNLVAVPPSHMMLRTFLKNDTISYPWLAAAGTRRGIIDNATNIGYLDGQTGEFITTKTNIGIRDVLYINFINPLVFFTGVGLLNYGNKTSYNSSSALDRTNVARLIAYIRRQLTLAARPFVFEPNDALTRNQIAGVVQTLLVDLVAKRGLYDYLVVCDESNNTPARIDRNQLWIDVAIEPVKAAEFIYIPVRVLNTGELQSLQ
jgi:hypothetical protein